MAKKKNKPYFNSNSNQIAYGHVQVPPKLRCKACQYVKSKDQFSNKQLEDLRRIANNAGHRSAGNFGSVGMIACYACTDQAVEMHCINCEEYKPLNEFAKTHRKRPDEAKCMACMGKTVNLEPDEAPDLDDEELEEELAKFGFDGEEGGSDAYDSNDGDDTESRTANMGDDESLFAETMSVTTAGGVRLPNAASSTVSAAGSGWVEQKKGGWQTASKKGSTSKRSSSFNPSAYSTSRASSFVGNSRNMANTTSPQKKWAKAPRASNSKQIDEDLDLLEHEDEHPGYERIRESILAEGKKGKAVDYSSGEEC